MKYLRQFFIFAIVAFIAEALKLVVPLPIPASVWGMLTMFVLLCTKMIKLEQVEATADFLLAVMAVFFIPFSSNLINDFGMIKDILPVMCIIIIVSTAVCFFVTGKISEFIIKKTSGRE